MPLLPAPVNDFVVDKLFAGGYGWWIAVSSFALKF